jgi:hypothetical protein
MSKSSESAGAGEKNECPFCLETVVSNPNCFICMTCMQKMHGICNTAPAGPYNQGVRSAQPGLHKMVMDRAATKGDARLLKDDILTCPVCNGDSIAYCFSPDSDLNEEMKEAVAANPMAKGGRRLRRQRKSRKTRKNNRRTRNKKARKTKLRRKR